MNFDGKIFSKQIQKHIVLVKTLLLWTDNMTKETLIRTTFNWGWLADSEVQSIIINAGTQQHPVRYGTGVVRLLAEYWPLAHYNWGCIFIGTKVVVLSVLTGMSALPQEQLSPGSIWVWGVVAPGQLHALGNWKPLIQFNTLEYRIQLHFTSWRPFDTPIIYFIFFLSHLVLLV